VIEQYVVIWLFGLMYGSFLNVVIYRVPNDESIVFPSSACPSCGNKLKFYHNIPIFSYLFLRGKCAFCATKISPQYPIVELLTSLLFLAVFLKSGVELKSLFIALSFSTLLALSVIDLKYKAVPDSLNLLALLFALAGGVVFVKSFEDALLFAGAFGLLRIGLSYLIKREAMGEGDIPVAATIGAMVGIKLGLFAIFLSAVLAMPFSLRGRVKENAFLDKVEKMHFCVCERNLVKFCPTDLYRNTKFDEIPYIPFLAMALFLVYLFDATFLELWTLIYA
jgi:leader peptidase (prepilin peptidase)/N-methyltransferase